MGLEELFESLTEEQQIFQFGVETDNPLAHAFPGSTCRVERNGGGAG
nr:hypothetical protein [uncultured Megasphaera sp.]